MSTLSRAVPARRPLIERSAASKGGESVEGARVVKPGDPDYEKVYAEAVRMHGYGYEMPYAEDGDNHEHGGRH